MIIKTKQFILRHYKMTDAHDIAKNINNKKIIRCLALNFYPYQLKHAKDFLNKNIPEYKNKKPSTYVMAIEIDGEVIGGIGLANLVSGHKAEIGFWLSEKYWGNGIMTQVVKKFTNYVFKKFDLKRVYGEVFLFNPGSKKVLEKCGFQEEGVLRKSAKKGNKYLDLYIFSKIR